MKRAFTLAEIMIVLAVIGVLSAILIPIARNSMPDENIMKFKKAHNALLSAIRELVTSDKYYLDGDLGIKADGNLVDSPTYFCETLSEILNTKNVNCSNIDNNRLYSHFHINETAHGTMGTEYVEIEYADTWCKEQTQAGAEIVLSNGVVFYQVNPAWHYGVKWILDSGEEFPQRLFGAPVYTYDATGFDMIYKPFCIDIDGIGVGEDAFGYGIRADGKIILGTRAKEWLDKEIQEKD